MASSTVLDYQPPPKRSGFIKRQVVSMLVALFLVASLAYVYDRGSTWYRDYRFERHERAMTEKLATYHPTPDVLCWSNDPTDLVAKQGYTLGNGWIVRDGPTELATSWGGSSDVLFVRIPDFWDNSVTTKNKPLAIRLVVPVNGQPISQTTCLYQFCSARSGEWIYLPAEIAIAKRLRVFTAIPHQPDARMFAVRIEIDGQPRWLHIDFDRTGRDKIRLSDSQVPATSPAN